MDSKRYESCLARRPAALPLAALFMFSALLRLWPLFEIRLSWEDAYFYIELARSLSRGRWELLGSFHSKYLPGFPAAIALLHALLMRSVDWFRSAQLVSMLASSAVPMLCFTLGKRITGDNASAWACGLTAALNAHLVVWGAVPFSEALFSFQVMLTLVLVPRAPLAAGLVAGWAALTRLQGLLLMLCFVAALFGGGDRRRLMAGLALMALVAFGWWALSYAHTGQWPYQVYLQESAERAPWMGRSGLKFLLLSVPVAGHLLLLFALLGLLRFIKSRYAWPGLLFFAAYAALHSWWMFPVERYFMPLVPVLCLMAGCGLLQAGRWIKACGRRSLIVVFLGFFAGGTHLAGFAPGLLQEETSRTRGYVQAVEYVNNKPGSFTVMAYDAFLAAHHGPRHPVIPAGMLGGRGWMQALPGLYLERGLRYIVWSDLYPSDRAKHELADLSPLTVSEQARVKGAPRKVRLKLVPEKVFDWELKRKYRKWWLPWRRMVSRPRTAAVYRLELVEGGG